MDTDTQRQTHTHGQTDRRADTHTDTQTRRYRQTHGHTHEHTERLADTDTHMDTHIDMQTQTDIHMDTQTCRHTETHTGLPYGPTSARTVTRASLLYPRGGARRQPGLHSPQTSSPGLCRPGQGDGGAGRAGQAKHQGTPGQGCALGAGWGPGAAGKEPGGSRTTGSPAAEAPPHPGIGAGGRAKTKGACIWGVFPPLCEPTGERRIPPQAHRPPLGP